MTSKPPVDRRWRTSNSIQVIANALVGGVFGAAYGIFGGFVPWLICGLVSGASLGLANELLFQRVGRLARWYRLRTVVLVLGESLLVLYVVPPVLGAYHATHPTRVSVVSSPAGRGLTYEEVGISAADGTMLRGWYIPSRNRAAIIAVHGSDANREQMLWHAQALAEEGYGVLLFDLRGHGESDGRACNVTNAGPDVAAAVAYLHGREEVDPERIGAVGLSLGAEVIIQAAAGEPGIKALVADGASTNRMEDMLPLPPEHRLMYVAAPMWWLSDRMAELMCGAPARPLVALVEEIAPRPILFISGNEEPETFMNRRLHERAGPAAQLWEISDAGHVGGRVAHPEEYKRRMVSFFDGVFRDP